MFLVHVLVLVLAVFPITSSHTLFLPKVLAKPPKQHKKHSKMQGRQSAISCDSLGECNKGPFAHKSLDTLDG